MERLKANFDYELELADVPFSKRKSTQIELEYLIFFCKKEEYELCSEVKYEKSYIEYLKSLGLYFPKLVKKSNSKNWWGTLENKSLMKKLNSKKFSSLLSEKYSLNNIPFFVWKSEDVFPRDKVASWNFDKIILREDLSFSGIGNRVVLKEDISKLNKIPEGRDFVVTPFLEKKVDFGVSFDLNKNKYFIFKNINSSSGVFTGGEIVDLEYISNLSKLDSQLIEENILEIKKILVKEGYENNVQVDMFSYELDKKIKLNSLVEINYRKTMAYVTNQLQESLGAKKLMLQIRKNNKKFKSFKDQLDHLSKNLYNGEKGIIPLSPISNKLLLYALVYDESNELDRFCQSI